MALFHQIYRSIVDVKETFLSKCRILNLRLKYPSLYMDSKCLIAKNCVVVCVDGADFKITNTYLGPGTFIVVEKGASLKISDSYIGPRCVIVAKEYIEIKSNCSIAEMVVIRDQDHDHSNGKLIRDSNDITGKIVIGENVWIGAKATVLKNVCIGSNSVVGAHSLVNSDFPENSVVGGIPARPIK